MNMVPDAFAILVWAPLLLAMLALCGTLLVLILRQGRTPVVKVPRAATPKRPRMRHAHAPAFARP